jgi:hypothetical protein
VGNRRTVLLLTLVLVLLLLQIPNAYSEESTAEDKFFDFLSDVIGLDMTKYTSPQPIPPPNPQYPEEFGGLVEQIILSPDFEYNETNFGTMGIFYNGHMSSLKLYYYGQDDYIYSETQPTDILSRAKGILLRYQTFASQNYAKDTSYLVSMLDILNSVDDLSSKEITEGNVTFQVSKDGDKTSIKWIFTESDILVDWKRVDITFRYNAFESFHDTWGLYNVSGLSVTSSEEVVQIALEAAQNCELRIGHENGEIEIVKVTDLSNAPYSVSLTIAPYRYNEDYIPSTIERDPLTLYPYWAVLFYFNETIAGVEGIQVGVWGDTNEILYCSGFGYLIPEFPSWTLLSLFLVFTLVGVLVKKRLSLQN